MLCMKYLGWMFWHEEQIGVCLTTSHFCGQHLANPYSHAGLVAQQQCCGPLQIPVSDVAVYAQSHQDLTGNLAALLRVTFAVFACT